MAPKRIPIEDRFWTKVQKTNTCWVWTAMHDKDGYGQISDKPRSSKRRAHCVSWELLHGAIPDEMLVLHSCDNPSCVRPEHLFLGTPKDNSKDMVLKNRQAKGSKQGISKLTENQVYIIKNKFDQTMRSLAKEFNVSEGTIWFIKHDLTWKHVPCVLSSSVKEG